MNSCELVSIITAVSCAIAECVPREELPLVAAVLNEIANTLGTITIYTDLACPQEASPSPGKSPPENGNLVLPPSGFL